MVPAGVFAAVLVATFWLANRLGMRLPLEWAVQVYLVPALAGYWLANRPRIEGRAIHRWLWSQLCYPFQPRRLVRMEPVWRAQRLRLDLAVYQPRSGARRREGWRSRR